VIRIALFIIRAPTSSSPLHEGTVEDDGTLVCAAHAARFDLTTGESIGIPQIDNIPVYACRIENGSVLVDLEQQTNAVG